VVSDTIQTLVAQHPLPELVEDPGPAPEYKLSDDNAAWTAWNRAASARNEYIRKVRLHAIAGAVDRMRERERVSDLSPHETISLILGIAFLESNGHMGNGILGLLGVL
jgi:hypothetical protein